MPFIIGVDEAGRGPLAGPVAVGIVRVPESFDILHEFAGINDSKKLSEKKREKIFEEAKKRLEAGDIHFCVKSVSAADIDRAGISRAVISGVHSGVLELAPESAGVRVYLDGLLRAPEGYEQETIVGGDGKIPAIMLASVVAKVVRDRYMVSIAPDYPEYGFEAHKGYGTKAHQEAIRTHGLSVLHRRSFCRAFDTSVQPS